MIERSARAWAKRGTKTTAMRVLGLDPGLRHTGWGVIEAEGNHLRHLANGVVVSDAKADLAQRLLQLHRGIAGSRLDVYEGWAHVHHFEDLDRFNDSTTAFVLEHAG